ncbi:MAG: class IV adenylate cyclase [Acidobacteriota bacterium]
MNATNLEREVKLRFDSPASARRAVAGMGAVPHAERRLQEDTLFDTEDGSLRRLRSLLRVRGDGRRSWLTFKGPVQPGPMKLREEIETEVGDGALVRLVLERLGYRAWFRYQKHREEYVTGNLVVAIDETPIGTFVELEGSESAIAAAAVVLGRGPGDYILDSYHALFQKHREALGFSGADMVFDDPGRMG